VRNIPTWIYVTLRDASGNVVGDAAQANFIEMTASPATSIRGVVVQVPPLLNALLNVNDPIETPIEF
jgi:hypothetical protein